MVFLWGGCFFLMNGKMRYPCKTVTVRFWPCLCRHRAANSQGPLLSEVGTTEKALRALILALTVLYMPESSLDCLMRAIFAGEAGSVGVEGRHQAPRDLI